MIFKRAVQRYGRTLEPETPFQRAGQLWDERIGSARVQARNWRWMAFACLGLTCALSGGLLWQSLQSRVVPYVIEVDRLGETQAVAPAEAGYHPTDPQIAWFLSRFIAAVRSISLDPVLMRLQAVGQGGTQAGLADLAQGHLVGLDRRDLAAQVAIEGTDALVQNIRRGLARVVGRVGVHCHRRFLLVETAAGRLWSRKSGEQLVPSGVTRP